MNSGRKTFVALLVCAAFHGLAAGAPAQALDAPTLRAKYVSLGPQLRNNAFHRPLQIESSDSARGAQGDVYAVLNYPFAEFSAAMSDPSNWCDLLMLHLNTKACRGMAQDGGARIEMRVGKKYDQPAADASLLVFSWRAVSVNPDFIDVELDAPQGPYSTSDYRIVLEAVPLANGSTFMHLGYAFAFGALGHWAMHAYLGTIARDKIGFSMLPPEKPGERGNFVGGTRGLVERNVMRYYLAIDAYLSAMRLAPAQQLDKRLQYWFDQSELYAPQLHEMDRDSYLAMKRSEYRRQQAAR